MILFKKDWKKYPGAIVDINTTNKSWKRTALIYKSMGIDNCEFLLALHNPLLKDVDPHDPNITADEIAMVTEEMQENPWYFFREIVRIPAVAGPDDVPFRANRANIAMLWLFFNHVTTLLIQPRQTGKSVSTDALMVYLMLVGSVKTDINLLTKDDSLRVKNVTRIKNIMSGLPYYVDLRSRTDTNNTEKVTVNRLGNTYMTAVPQASVKAALNLGRGMTIAVNHIDEIAFLTNIDITLPELLTASSSARDSAAETGAPYGNVFTTTPGYLSAKSGKFVYDRIYKKALLWTEKLFDSVDMDELHTIVTKNTPEEELLILLEFNHRQLGYTDQWLKKKIKDAMSHGEHAGADYLNIWAEGSEAAAIPKNLLKVIKNSLVREPYVEISKFGYITRWYIKENNLEREMNVRKTILALDTSDAIGNDDIGLVIRDAATGEVLGTGVYNETNLITFSEWLIDWLERFDNITMIIERKSSGVAIMDNLLKLLPIKGIDPFRRMFNWVVDDSAINKKYREEVIDVPLNKRSNIVYEKYRKYFGYATSSGGRNARDNLYGAAFMASTKYTGNVVRDKMLIAQLSGLTIKNDRIDHKSGNHDDMVIAWLMAYWFLTSAKNKSYYGLDSNNVLSTVTNAIVDEQGGKEAIVKRNKQIRLKSIIDGMLEQLKVTNDKVSTFRLINKIKFMYQRLDTSVIQTFNIEAMIENIELNKRKNIRFGRSVA